MQKKADGIGGHSDDRLFERARQSMALSDFLEGLLGEQPKKAGGHYRFDSCPHCGQGHSKRLVVFLPDNERYFCHKCGAQGSIIDAAMIAQNFSSPLDAAKFLTGETDMPQAAQQRRQAPQIRKESQVAAGDSIRPLLETLLKMSGNSSKPVPAPVLEYLTGRGLSSRVITEAWSRKFFLALDGEPRQISSYLNKALGKEVLAEMGLLNDKGAIKIVPYRPLIFPLSHKDSAEFRIIRAPREGELKSITKGLKNHDLWFWKGKEGNTEAMIVEGAIDLLSAVDMGFQGTIFGLPGVTSFGDGSRLIEALSKVGCTKVWLALDNDDAGKKASIKLSEILSGRFGLGTISHEGDCNDLNDVLLYRQKSKVVARQPIEVVEEVLEPVMASVPIPAPVQTPVMVQEQNAAPASTAEDRPTTRGNTPVISTKIVWTIANPAPKKPGFFRRLGMAAQILFGQGGAI